MAVSFAHKFGQIIGELLEMAVEPRLSAFAVKHGLFLDRKGTRKARQGRKVTWTDAYGNAHDLDFVLERGGTDTEIGCPVAFIETAWRRYTKHSRNKAQEIQGAIQPLFEKYRHVSPFKGVVLAGDFTEGALQQIGSLGFAVLHVSCQTVWDAFKAFGIDATFGEETKESEFKKKISEWNRLSDKDKRSVAKKLLVLNKRQTTRRFFDSLKNSVSRRIVRIVILPLHGSKLEVASIAAAVEKLDGYDEATARAQGFVKYEVSVWYNTGCKVEASCPAKSDAIDFLNGLTKG